MSEDVFSLPVDEELGAHVSRRRLGGLPVIVVDHPRSRAAVALQGAHLFAWQPAGQEPVLWLSEASAFTEGTAIRGGVPVCWPWFGPTGQPSHGFARVSTFELVASEEDESEVRLDFVLRSDEHTKQIWPHDFALFIRMRLGATCEVSLEAQGEYESTGALHSYFHVGAIEGVRVSGIGVPYLDQVEDTDGSQDGPLDFPGRIDRVYTAPEPVSRIDDPALHREIEVRHHDHSDVVTWNPGPELSKSMADLTDDGYRGFVCVETARISDPMISTADRPATLSVTFAVAPRDH
ncbi:glucose-6-phosphate 1-epimerase [Catenulispora sp. GP43]|uniref:D-hexose-6-phosphate mutarotase n=1 Tax=Catenulispora sp. GP43 TaxID=3156263 RepID=UPI00351530C1